MQKQFHELAIGDRFTVNGVEYIKTEEVRVSCCRSINCYASSDANQKGHFPGNTEVTING
jgi:hypothetical protein